MTWIVSFTAPAKKFRLFCASDASKIINRKPAITRHDPGCQGFCVPAKCQRYARCSHCGTRTDQHEGPYGVLCTHHAQCANCLGPFPSDHKLCPAAPKRRNGIVIKLTKKELSAVRRHGTRDFKDSHPEPTAEAPSQANAEAGQQTPPTPAPRAPAAPLPLANTLKRKHSKGAVITETTGHNSRPSSSGSIRQFVADISKGFSIAREVTPVPEIDPDLLLANDVDMEEEEDNGVDVECQ